VTTLCNLYRKEEYVQDFCLTGVCGFCLSSYIELVIPVVAMLSGLGLRGGALRRRTGPLPAAAAPLPRPDIADPGREAAAVEFSRDRPGTVSKLGICWSHGKKTGVTNNTCWLQTSL
jgi:hypothetical protein